MTPKVKIKTIENNNIHFNTHRNCYTLCGLDTQGDESIGIGIAKKVNKKVNCPDCVRIVEYCQKIAVSEFTQSGS